MNNNNQTQNNETQRGIDHCKTTFNVSGQEVINTYKCNQGKFTASDMWNIQKQKRRFTINQGLTIN